MPAPLKEKPRSFFVLFISPSIMLLPRCRVCCPDHHESAVRQSGGRYTQSSAIAVDPFHLGQALHADLISV